MRKRPAIAVVATCLAAVAGWRVGVKEPDARVVLVRGVWAAVFDVRTGSESRVDLVDADGYPGSREATGLRFSDDGQALLFRVCQRSGGPCDAVERKKIVAREVP